jgi:hypothetical protein
MVARCGRQQVERRTPGRHDSPDGKTTTWVSTCELPKDHEGPHDWQVWRHEYEV